MASPGSSTHLAQQVAVVVEQLDVHDAALHDEHLLQVVDLARATALW